ncbi:hypothetical protein ABIE65_000501 [Constrictibacter sp. MBR-5]|jgi:hypothetical protein|uniref:hypothetical protein n=1 Tax=Constrictibacter sp. MBR-5 TaxID=3156467 RepID=UPI003397BC43
MRKHAVAAGLVLLCWVGAAQAECNLRISEVRTGSILDYDPFRAGGSIGRMFVEVQNPGSTSCRGRLVLETRGSTNLAMHGPGGSLIYRLRGPQRQYVRTTGAPADGVPFVAAAGRPTSVDFQVEVNEGQMMTPGVYLDNLRLVLLDAETDQVLQEVTGERIAAEVLPRVQSNLAGTAGAFSPGATFSYMDFGILETGESQSAFLQVRANTAVRIRVSSENGGVLKHVEQPGLPSVAYTARLDGVPADMSAPIEIMRRPPVRSTGTNYEIRVTIGDVRNKFAGRYRDTVTVEIDPQ